MFKFGCCYAYTKNPQCHSISLTRIQSRLNNPVRRRSTGFYASYSKTPCCEGSKDVPANVYIYRQPFIRADFLIKDQRKLVNISFFFFFLLTSSQQKRFPDFIF